MGKPHNRGSHPEGTGSNYFQVRHLVKQRPLAKSIDAIKVEKAVQSGPLKISGRFATPLYRCQLQIDVLAEESLLSRLQLEALAKFEVLYKVKGAGNLLSQEERKKLGNEGDNSSFTYGEITFATWATVLARANPPKGSVFYDLGSGTLHMRSFGAS